MNGPCRCFIQERRRQVLGRLRSRNASFRKFRSSLPATLDLSILCKLHWQEAARTCKKPHKQGDETCGAWMGRIAWPSAPLSKSGRVNSPRGFESHPSAIPVFAEFDGWTFCSRRRVPPSRTRHICSMPARTSLLECE